jgi:hypothetical protein
VNDCEGPGEDRVAPGDAGAVRVADAAGDGVLVLPGGVAERVADAGALADGEKIAGWGVPEAVHPATAAATSTSKVAAPAAGRALAFIMPAAFGMAAGGGPSGPRLMRNGVFPI